MEAERETLNLRLEREATLYLQIAAIHSFIQQMFSEHVLYAKLSSRTKNTVANKTAKTPALIELTFKGIKQTKKLGK